MAKTRSKAKAKSRAKSAAKRPTKSRSKAKAKARSKAKSKPSAKARSRRVTTAGLKRAIEERDAAALAGLYTDDAVLLVIDRDNPPSRPRIIEGRDAIAAYLDDVCGREMTHQLETGVAEGDRLAFTQTCAYPDGTRVFCSAMMELEDDMIVRQVVVQAWDS